jgi:hypothetical protein
MGLEMKYCEYESQRLQRCIIGSVTSGHAILLREIVCVSAMLSCSHARVVGVGAYDSQLLIRYQEIRFRIMR